VDSEWKFGRRHLLPEVDGKKKNGKFFSQDIDKHIH
jgi:hypothetical protein